MSSAPTIAPFHLELEDGRYGPTYITSPPNQTRRLSVSRTTEHGKLLNWMKRRKFRQNYPTCGRRPDADDHGSDEKWHFQFTYNTKAPSTIVNPAASDPSLSRSSTRPLSAIIDGSADIAQLSFSSPSAQRLALLTGVASVATRFATLRIDTPKEIPTITDTPPQVPIFSNLEKFTLHGHPDYLALKLGFSWEMSFPSLQSATVEGRYSWKDIRAILCGCPLLQNLAISAVVSGSDDAGNCAPVHHNSLTNLTIFSSIASAPIQPFKLPKLYTLKLWFTPRAAHKLDIGALGNILSALDMIDRVDTCVLQLNYNLDPYEARNLPTNIKIRNNL